MTDTARPGMVEVIPKRDLTGMRIGKLTVIEPDGYYTYPSNGKKATMWRCKCDCGNETRVIGYGLLKKSPTQSCGCLQKERAIERADCRPQGEAGFNRIYYQYQAYAKERGLEFHLPKDYFYTLTQKNCYYCGASPAQISKVKTQRSKFTYNGVDRIDSMEHYIPSNCVPCCGVCNIAKSYRSLEDFYDWATRLFDNLVMRRINNARN